MRKYAIALALITLVAGLTLDGRRALSGTRQGFGFNAELLSGFPDGRAAELTGGGSYDQGTGSVKSGGGFRCLADITGGPFSGCLAGEGVRWDTVDVLPSTAFKCTGDVAEAGKTATTSDTTVVLVADFYRQGDGDIESFTAKMFVSKFDLAPDIPGLQNVWIQGIGCSAATTNFN